MIKTWTKRTALMLAVSPLALTGANAFEASVEGLYLHRDVDNTVLFSDNEGSTSSVFGDDLDVDWDAGFALSIAMPVDDKRTLEIGGMYIQHDGSAGLTNTSDQLDVPGGFSGGTFLSSVNASFTGGNFSSAVTGFADFESTTWSIEANVWQDWGGTRVFYGVRYINFDDQLSLFVDDDGAGLPAAFGTLDIDMDNDLFGIQAGVTESYDLGNRWSISGKGGAGLYYADREKTIVVFEGRSPSTTSFSQEDNGLAIVFDGEVTLDWALSDRVTLSLGYQVLWIGNVGEALDNLPIANTAAEYTKFEDDGVLYHGGLLRATFTF